MCDSKILPAVHEAIAAFAEEYAWDKSLKSRHTQPRVLTESNAGGFDYISAFIKQREEQAAAQSDVGGF